MAAFSIFAPRGASNVSLLGVYGYDLEIGPDNEEVELAAGGFALSALENHSCFKCGRCRQKAILGRRDGLQKRFSFRFDEEDGD